MRFAIRALATAVLLAGVSALPAAADHGSGGLSVRGTLVDNVQLLPGTSTAGFRLRLDRLSTAAESEHFRELFRERGGFALRTALYEDPIGRVEIGDRLGWPIGYAQRFDDAQGSHLVLLALRPIAFRETVQSARSRDYPFTAVLVDLDAGGVRHVEVLPAAKVRSLEDGRLDLVNLVEQPMPVLGLRVREF